MASGANWGAHPFTVTATPGPSLAPICPGLVWIDYALVPHDPPPQTEWPGTQAGSVRGLANVVLTARPGTASTMFGSDLGRLSAIVPTHMGSGRYHPVLRDSRSHVVPNGLWAADNVSNAIVFERGVPTSFYPPFEIDYWQYVGRVASAPPPPPSLVSLGGVSAVGCCLEDGALTHKGFEAGPGLAVSASDAVVTFANTAPSQWLDAADGGVYYPGPVGVGARLAAAALTVAGGVQAAAVTVAAAEPGAASTWLGPPTGPYLATGCGPDAAGSTYGFGRRHSGAADRYYRRVGSTADVPVTTTCLRTGQVVFGAPPGAAPLVGDAAPVLLGRSAAHDCGTLLGGWDARPPAGNLARVQTGSRGLFIDSPAGAPLCLNQFAAPTQVVQIKNAAVCADARSLVVSDDLPDPDAVLGCIAAIGARLYSRRDTVADDGLEQIGPLCQQVLAHYPAAVRAGRGVTADLFLDLAFVLDPDGDVAVSNFAFAPGAGYRVYGFVAGEAGPYHLDVYPLSASVFRCAPGVPFSRFVLVGALADDHLYCDSARLAGLTWAGVVALVEGARAAEATIANCLAQCQRLAARVAELEAAAARV